MKDEKDQSHSSGRVGNREKGKYSRNANDGHQGKHNIASARVEPPTGAG